MAILVPPQRFTQALLAISFVFHLWPEKPAPTSSSHAWKFIKSYITNQKYTKKILGDLVVLTQVEG